MAVNGVAGARYMIEQLEKPTPYSEADCIQAAVVNVIRHCAGGDPSYRCGGCTELWNSIDSSPKYKFITERLTIAEAKQSGLLIGDLPCIYDETTGKCEHIGYYMGGIGGYEVIHSSQTRQWVAATQLKNGFTHILRHRLIRGVSPSAVNDAIDEDESEMIDMSALYQGAVCTDEGGHLNLRLKPSTAGRVLDELENGSSVSVLEETNASWLKVSAGGRTGYVFRRYIQKKAGSTESTDDAENTQTGFGVFIPCNTKETADAVASCFANAVVCKRGADD